MNNKFESMDSKIANLTLNSGYENKTLNQLINHLSFKLKKLLLTEHGLVIQIII